MPYCKECGNKSQFGSSRVSTVAPYSNGPISGVLGSFDDSGSLTGLTRMGANRATTKAAFSHPVAYFDICAHCGNTDIEW